MTTASSVASLEAPLHRIRRGRAIGFVSAPHEDQPKTPSTPRVARVLALAHALQALLGRGAVPSRAELAVVTGFTRARITQLLDLTLLAPDIQERIVDGDPTIPRGLTARALRPVVRLTIWADQRKEFERLVLKEGDRRC